MSYVNEHRWPPLSYEQAMDEYRRKYMEEEGEEEENEREGERDSGEEQGESLSREGRRGRQAEEASANSKHKRERCKVM